MSVLHRCDPTTNTLQINSHLIIRSAGVQDSRRMWRISKYGDLINHLVAEGKFTSDESHTLARARVGQLLPSP